MNETQTKVMEIIDSFSKQEIGNRLSEFAMLALRAMIVKALEDEPVAEKVEV